MAESKKKPLFNRRYLLILVWVLPIVILLLQSGAGESPVDRIQWDAGLQAYVLPLEQDDIQLGLVLPLPQTLTDQAWIENRVRVQALQQRLSQADLSDWLASQGWQAKITKASTHLLIRIHMAQPPRSQQLDQFYSRLTQLNNINTEAMRKRARAERYLQSHQDETRLLAALGEGLSTTDSPFVSNPVWILSGDIDTGADTAPATPTRTSASDWPPRQIVLNESSRQPTLSPMLIGQPQPAPLDGADLARQRLAAELVALLLPQQLNGDVDYRWIWKPLAANGYRALLLPTKADTTAQRVAPLNLAQLLTEELLEQTRTSLLQRYDQIIDEQPERWLELVALYHLPLDSYQAFRDTLNKIDLDAARALISNFFDPGQSLQIRFASTGNPS